MAIDQSIAGESSPPFGSAHGGTPHSALQHCANLRLARTELELLRRIGRRIAAAPDQDQPICDERYNDADRTELLDIARKASDSNLEQTIQTIDRQYPELRRQLLISAIDDRAEGIWHDIQQSGVLSLRTNPPPGKKPEPTSAYFPREASCPEVDIDALLEFAESRLSQIAKA